jgi:transposase-like protein
MMSRRKFSKEFKLAAVQRIQAGEAVPRLARVLEVSPSDLYRWCREAQGLGERGFSDAGSKKAEERAAELERKIGQQALEIDFLRRALQHVEEQRRLRAASIGASSTNISNGKSKRERC